jgi:hypothetical protein
MSGAAAEPGDGDFAATPENFLHNLLAPALNQIEECGREQNGRPNANDDSGIHDVSPFS